MKKLFLILAVGLGVTGCATTTQPGNEVSINHSPKIIYVMPSDPWRHHHWHWTWHHRHGWGWHHPRHHHFHVQPLPHKDLGDQRRTIPTPINPGRPGGPSGEHLRNYMVLNLLK